MVMVMMPAAAAVCTEKLLLLVKEHPSDVFIVFCNTVPSCDWTAHYLESGGVPVVKLHAGFSPAVSVSTSHYTHCGGVCDTYMHFTGQKELVEELHYRRNQSTALYRHSLQRHRHT